MSGESVAPERGVDADSPTEVPARGWVDVARRVKGELRVDHSALSAAGVAYFGFLSLVPALARITDSSSGSLGLSLVVSIALALWAASSGVAHLVEAITIAYDEGEGRGFVRRRGQALLFTLGGVLAAIVVTTLLAVVPELGGDSGIGRFLLLAATWAIVAVVVLAGLAALYRFGPDRDDPKWRWVTPGSIIAMVAWLAVSIGFQVYTANFGSYDATYGALAAVVLLLIWLYLTGLLVIVGAEVNAELEHQTAQDSTTGPDRPLGARDAEMADRVAPQPS